MTIEHDFDPEIARRLEARLAPFAPVARISATRERRPSRSRLLVGVALATALATSVVGLGYQINASAEAQGLGCLHPVAKVQLYAQGLFGSGDAGHHATTGAGQQQHDQRTDHTACHQ